MKHIVSTWEEEQVATQLMHVIQSIILAIYSLTPGIVPRFSVFLPGKEAKTLLTTLGTMAVTQVVYRVDVSVVVGSEASKDDEGAYRTASLIRQGANWCKRPHRCHTRDS